MQLTSSSSQTSLEMADAMCQTTEALINSALMLDVAVQTICSYLDEESSPKVKLKNKLQEEGDGEDSRGTDRLQELLNSSLKDKKDDEYPCQLCSKTFSSLFSVKTHIYVAHPAVFRKKGVLLKAKPSKKLTASSQKRPWCRLCQKRFPSRSEFAAHKAACHPAAAGDPPYRVEPAKSGERLDAPSEDSTGYRYETAAGPRPRRELLSVKLKLEEGQPIADLHDVASADSSPEKGRSGPPRWYGPERVRPLDVKLVRIDRKLKLDSRGSLKLWPEEEQEEEERELSQQGKESDDEEEKMDEEREEHEEEERVTREEEEEEEVESLPWYEARFHSCLLCGREVPLGNFSTHLKDRHQISFSSYREQHPDDDLSVDAWTCALCQQDVKWSQPTISQHLRKNHALSLQEYASSVMCGEQVTRRSAEPSLPWFESRRHQCRICDGVFLFSQIYDHLRLKHFVSFGDYKQIFPEAEVELPTWRCLVCNITITHARRPIQQHLSGRHEMTLKQYEAAYIFEAATAKPSHNTTAPAEAEEDDSNEPLLPLDSLECLLDVKTEPDLEAESEKPRPKPVKLEARERPPPTVQQDGGSSGSGGGKMVWVPWFESKLTSCLICGETRTCGLSFKNHLYDRHKYLSRKEYMRRFPEADIEPAQWNCPICRNTVKWTKKCIVDHLRVAHSLTRENFEAAYNILPNHQVASPGGGSEGGGSRMLLNARTDIGIANRASTSSGGGDSSSESAAVRSGSLQRCSLCEERIESSVFAEHISDYHKMTRESYLKLCPADLAKFMAHTSEAAAASKDSLWTCKICEEDLDPAGDDQIQNHLEEAHALAREDYQRLYEGKAAQEEEEEELEDMSNLVVDEGIEAVEDEEASILPETEEKILGGHSIFESEQDDYENIASPGTGSKGQAIPPWYEAVKIRCEECHSELWLGAFMKHIILTHKLPIKVYKAKYPETLIPKRQYKCRICGISVSHYASPISGHLSGRHNITMTDYYLRYEKPQVAPPSPPPPPPLPPSLLALEHGDRKRSQRMAGLMSEDSADASPTMPSKNLRMAEYQKTGKIPWYESRITDCRLCGEEWLLGSFRRHLYDRHDKISRTAYKEMFPDVDIDLPIWRCQICGNGIKWVRDNIFYHLRTHHFTLESYRRIYIDGHKSDGVDDVKAGLIMGSPSKPLPQLLPIQNAAAGGFASGLGGSSSSSSVVNAAGVKEKKFRCKICGLLVTFNTEAIRSHLQNFHNMSLNEYKPIYTTTSMAASTGENFIGCDSDGQHQMPRLFQTLSQQQLSTATSAAIVGEQPQQGVARLQPVGEQSADGGSCGGGGGGTAWYNRCKWTCMVCNKAFCSGFWRHVQEAHALAKAAYLEQYGKAGIDIIHYYCRICNRKIPWSGASINGHTKAEHGMSLKEYEQMYGPPPSEASPLHPLPQLPLFQLPAAFSLPHHRPQILPALLSQPLPQRNQTAEKWFNGCEYKCQMCARVLYSVAGLSLHLRDAHYMDKFTYFRQHGRAGIRIKKYKCKICQKCFPWSGVSISKHVKQAHSMSLQKYSAMYENDCGPFERISETEEEESASLSPSKMTGGGTPKQVKWFNKCSWTCQICGTTVTTNSSAFYKHVAEHQVPIDEYKEKYGNAGFVYVDHTCKLCKKRVPCNGLAMCKHFKHSHNMQLEEYETKFMRDDDGTSNSESYEPTDEFWYNKCVWKCQICGNKNRSMGSSKKHVQKAHAMTYDEYHAQYGTEGITEFNFKCRLCSVVMSCNGVTIASHLLNNHRLTLGEYEKKYLKSGGKGRVVLSSPDITECQPGSRGGAGGSGLLQGDHFLASLKDDEEAEEDRQPQPSEKEANKAWYQKCQYICQLCKNTYFSISALRNHVKVKHNMEREEYIQLYGNHAGRIIEDYECKLCHRVLKCEGRSLNAHMRNCHKMGIIEYSRKYEADRCGNVAARKAGKKQRHQDDPHYANEIYQIEMDNDDEEEEGSNGDVGASTSSAAHMVSIEGGEEDDEENTVSSFDPLSNVEAVEDEDDEEEEGNEEDEDAGDDDEMLLREEEDEEDEEFVEESLDLVEEDDPDEDESLELKPDISQMKISPVRNNKNMQEERTDLPIAIASVRTSNLLEQEEDDEDIADYSEDLGVADDDHEAEDIEEAQPVNGESSSSEPAEEERMYITKVQKKELLTS